MIKTKKKFGQHWLINKGVVEKILNALEAEPGDRFLEIGPGPGTLTLPLNRQGFGFTVVEFDPDMTAYLEKVPFDPPITIRNGDFLKLPLDSLIETETKVFSNLPYQTSVPITARLLRVSRHVPLMVMMYQREVAERIRAQPGGKAYSPISILTQAIYDIDLHFNVAAGSFQPPPKVISQVLRFRRKQAPLLQEDDLDKMTTFINGMFKHRRKTIKSNMKAWREDWPDKSLLLESLTIRGHHPQSRPESLSPIEYVQWFRHLEERA